MSNSETVKVTLNLTKENQRTVESIAKDTGMNKTTVINRAIATEQFLRQAQKNDEKIFVEDRHGNIREIVWR